VLQHPAFNQALARDRVAELRHAARSGARRRCPACPGVAGAARNATGWFLVDVGLRLAIPRGITRSA
jgi:hypothetical protein